MGIGQVTELKRFANGNGHLFFGPDMLETVNKGLAEYYGEVLADCPEEAPKKRTGTAVSKDLAFYRTPDAAAGLSGPADSPAAPTPDRHPGAATPKVHSHWFSKGQQSANAATMAAPLALGRDLS